MPILAPSHYEDSEFSKLPRKINDVPIAWMGLTMQELLMIGGVFVLGFLMTFAVKDNLPLMITLAVLLVAIVVVMVMAFRYAHSVVKGFYWHNIKFFLDRINDPERWTGDAYAYAWGEDRDGKPMKGSGFKGCSDDKKSSEKKR